MKILVINCGSSSAKYELFDIPNAENKSLEKGIVQRILRYSDYAKAIKTIKSRLSARDIDGIGHRVVHGGEVFKKSAIITNKVIKTIQKF